MHGSELFSIAGGCNGWVYIREFLVKVSSLLLGSLEHVVDAQSQLDIVLSMAPWTHFSWQSTPWLRQLQVGNETDAALASAEVCCEVMGQRDLSEAISKHPELSLLQQHGPERGLVLLQELHQKNASRGCMSGVCGESESERERERQRQTERERERR